MSAVLLPLWDRTIAGMPTVISQPAVVSAIVTASVMLVLPWITEKARAVFGGRIDEAATQAKRIDRFYADVQDQLEETRKELTSAQGVNLELRRELIAWEAARNRWEDERRELLYALSSIREDVERMRDLISERMAEDKSASALSRLALRVLDAVRKGERLGVSTSVAHPVLGNAEEAG